MQSNTALQYFDFSDTQNPVENFIFKIIAELAK